MKQKTEIIFEVEETIILRRSEKILTEFCPQCQALVEMITPQIAAALFNLTEREIFRLIESGRLHFTEAEKIFICRNSLTNGTAAAPVNRRFINGEKNEKQQTKGAKHEEANL